MKKLRKAKTTLQDSIEAYEGVCDCLLKCNCACICQNAIKVADVWDTDDARQESSCLSIYLSHYSWS